MKASRWYKAFGGGREEKYYHIIEFDEDERVRGTLYIFNPLFRKVVREEDRYFDKKWWMEQELYNTVHEVAENSVPFLMKF
ncbi:hypothetical protein [Marispirochaeta aestuarii]|uniref:hypothetical protein n=1 Tax=Marispirochaeta aestuarii TaxID=1963862 RepID=UPI0029C752C9|nr:hypothetical protein [Marispirochaeta aestuarii]